MAGNKLFSSYKFLINIFCFFMRIFPRFLRSFMWDLSSVFSGYIAIVFRYSIIKVDACSLGSNVYIGKYVVLKNNEGLCIGSNVSIHDSCYIDSFGTVTIGDNVSIAHQSSILSFNHTWGDSNLAIKYNPIKKGSVVIKNDVWIGCGVRIMPGVILNERCVVAAGAVVTKDVASGTVVAGVPAKVVGHC